MKELFPLRNEQQREFLEGVLETYRVIGLDYLGIRRVTERGKIQDSKLYQKGINLTLVNDQLISTVKDRLSEKISDEKLISDLRYLMIALLQIKYTPELNSGGIN